MSDYTPENTITSSTTSSPPTISMCQSVSPEEPVTFHDSTIPIDGQNTNQYSNIDTKEMEPTVTYVVNQQQNDNIITSMQQQTFVEQSPSGRIISKQQITHILY